MVSRFAGFGTIGFHSASVRGNASQTNRKKKNAAIIRAARILFGNLGRTSQFSIGQYSPEKSSPAQIAARPTAKYPHANVPLPVLLPLILSNKSEIRIGNNTVETVYA